MIDVQLKQVIGIVEKNQDIYETENTVEFPGEVWNNCVKEYFSGIVKHDGEKKEMTVAYIRHVISNIGWFVVDITKWKEGKPIE